MRRVLLITVVLLGVLSLGSALALWAFLASWVPTKGRALLIQRVEAQWPVDVSIGSMRYRPLQGFLLEDVVVLEECTRTPWLTTPQLKVSIGWWSLLSQHLVFRLQAPLEAPGQTQLTASGRYRLREGDLHCRLRTTEVPLDTLTPVLKDRLPPQLREGAFRLNGQLTWQPESPAQITGQINATRLLWTEPPLRLLTDLTLDGQALAPADETAGWILDAIITVDRGHVEGLPRLETITGLEGTGHLTHERLEIEALRATSLGTDWTLEGTLEPLKNPSLEMLVRSRLELDRLGELVPLIEGWMPSGPADVSGVCRGPLQPSPTLDCLVRADVRGASLTAAGAPDPLTEITGRIDYDVLTGEASIESLTMQLREQPLAVRGRFTPADPPQIELGLDGTLDLQGLRGWLPPIEAIQELAGLASLDLMMRGPLDALRYEGRVELREGRVQLTGLPQPLERVQGVATLSEDRIELREVSMQIGDDPLTLVATLTSYHTVPRITAEVGVADGTLQLSGRWEPTRFVLDAGELALLHSKVQLSGEVGRAAQQPSQLTMRGIVELAEMARLPLVEFTAFDPSTVRGPIAVGIRFQGDLRDWRSATIQGQLGANHLSVRGVPLDDFLLELEQSQRTMRLDVLKARIADGIFLSRAILEHQPEATSFMMQLDLTNTQLAQLAQAIPQWQERAITGSASAHAVLSGTVEERATWRGDGWLNASGERLGDLPLLDKLFGHLFGALGNRLGLASLRRAEVTEVSLRWVLAEERLGTEDLRVGALAGTESIAIYVKGSVGLDQTLDLVIEPEFSEGTVLEAPTTATLAQTVLKAAGRFERLRRLIGHHRVRGTITDPEFRFEFGVGETLKQLAPSPVDFLQGLLFE